jgi:SAM-dependent methyltransferase
MGIGFAQIMDAPFMTTFATPPGDDQKGSPERFGYSWDRFHALTPEQERQFQLWTTHLSSQTDWKGTRFLDAGCGAGRNSYWAMSYGAASCVAVDLDERSLRAARENLRRFPTAEVRSCSIYDLDYRDHFDISFSIGVIHHLDNPTLAVRKMAEATKPGGQVLIWVYGYENLEFFVNVLNPARKLLFSWMPLWLVRILAYVPAAALWLLLRLGVTPFDYLRLLKGFPFRHLHHITFDQMLPRIANYWRRDEAVSLLRDAGLSDIKAAWVNEVSWSVIGTKRAE